MDLALGDDGRGAGQNAQHIKRSIGYHQLERAGKQEVADQHAGLVAPDRIGGRRAAPQIAFIDDVVMQQGRGMDKFDAGGESGVALAFIAAQPRRAQGQHRPQALAAGGDDMAGKLRYQQHLALHLFENDFVYARQIGRGQRHQPFERRCLALFALVVESDDVGHGDASILDLRRKRGEHRSTGGRVKQRRLPGQ